MALDVLLIVRDSGSLTAEESAARTLLEGRGDTVTLINDETAVPGDLSGYAAAVNVMAIPATVGTKWKSAAVPLVVCSSFLWDTEHDLCSAAGSYTKTQLDITDDSHPLAGGLSGTVTFASAGSSTGGVNAAHDGPDAIRVADVNGAAGNACILAYEQGGTMHASTAAVRRRVGWLTYQLNNLTADGQALFLAAVDWAASLPNQPPATPTVSADAVGSHYVLASSSAYSDPDSDPHVKTQWQITTAADTGFASPVIDTEDEFVQLETYRSPDNWLRPATDYLVRVRHHDGTNWSDWSAADAFSTTAADGWPAGDWEKRQLLALTAPDDHSFGEWVQYEHSGGLVNLAAGDGDVAVFLVDGTELPVQVVTRSDSALRLSVSLPGPASSTQPLHAHLYVKSAAASARPATGWGGAYTSPATNAHVGPTIDVSDGRGNTQAANPYWVHPHIVKVPTSGPGSWMRKVTDAGESTVTHIRVDTPYPGANDDYENPYLLYSTDDGDTWAEWPGDINPIAIRPADAADFHSDPCAVINKITGDLLVFYRLTTAGTPNTYALQRIQVTAGASLTTASVGTASTPTIQSTGQFLAPTCLYQGERLFLFYVENATTGAIYREWSDDDGVTWAGRQLVIDPIAATGDGEFDHVRRWWHGQATGPVGDWYYYALTEYPGEVPPVGQSAAVRIFRSRDLTRWEPARRLALVAGTSGAFNAADNYCPGVFEDSAGNLFLFSSGDDSAAGLNYRVCRVAASALNSSEIMTLGAAFTFNGADTMSYANSGNRGTVTELGSPEDAPPTVLYASVSLAGGVTITASGHMIREAAWATAGAGSLSSTARGVRPASWASVGAASLSAAGSRLLGATWTVGGAATVSAAATRLLGATATWQGTASVSWAPHQIHVGTWAAAGTATFSAVITGSLLQETIPLAFTVTQRHSLPMTVTRAVPLLHRLH